MRDEKYPRLELRPLVAVVGASSAEESSIDIAKQVGRAIRSEGWHLLTGGGGGVMEAACRGFRQAKPGGAEISIGILPTDDSGSANRFVDVSIPTGMGIARNAIISRAAWGLIVVGGCSGTLSEIAMAWQLGRPIASIVGSGGWAEKTAGIAIDDRRPDTIFPARSIKEAVEFLRLKMLRS
jgi:uncharacterized protein (TIGR00725 family)